MELEPFVRRARLQHRSVDAALEIAAHDDEAGGGIIAGALAYRFFIWLLPFALVLIGGLGVAADASSKSAEDAAGSVGLGTLVSGSVSSAAQSQGRWYALVIGVPTLLYMTRSLLRALIGAHRLVWGVPRRSAPRPTAGATLALLGVLVCGMVLSRAATLARDRSLAASVVAAVLLVVPYTGLWLALSLRLPHADAEWTALVPGAVVFAVGIELIHVGTTYVLGPMTLNKQGTYGALGIAAGLLLALYVISRLMVAAAAVNATLWTRRVTST